MSPESLSLVGRKASLDIILQIYFGQGGEELTIASVARFGEFFMRHSEECPQILFLPPYSVQMGPPRECEKSPASVILKN